MRFRCRLRGRRSSNWYLSDRSFVRRGLVIRRKTSEYFVRGSSRIAIRNNLWVDVETYETGGIDKAATQDALLVAFVGDALRLAVIDGVTPTRRTRGFRGVDGAVWAAGVVRTLLGGSDQSIVDVMRAANQALWSAEVMNSRDQQQATALVAEIRCKEHVLHATLARAGDCMAWIKTGESWTRLFSPVAHSPEVRKEVDEWFRSNPDETRDRNEQFAMEERLAGSPDAWRTSALGRFREPVIETAEIDISGELVIATDGLCGCSADPAQELTTMTFSPTDVASIHLKNLSQFN